MTGRLMWACVATLLMAVPGGIAAASAQSLTEALAEAYRTNPQLLAQRALLRVTDEMVPQALANWRPTVAFTGQTGYGVSAESAASAGAITPATTTAASITATMTMPLYGAGRSIRRPGKRSRRLGSGAASSTMHGARRSNSPTRAGRAALQAARAAIASFTAAVRAAQIALVGLQEEALTGTRTILDVLVGEQQLFTSQAQLEAAEHDMRSPSSTSAPRSAA
jgi:outer membrane protein TolC